MAPSQIRTFLIEIINKGKFHPLYQECLNAYLKGKCTSADTYENETAPKDDDFFASYKNLISQLKNATKLSDRSFIPEELEKLVAGLRPNVLGKQLQLLILQSILNYAKKNLGIDSPNTPSIITLKHDKPILTPVDLTKLPILELIISALNRELTTPNRGLNKQGKLGRLALLLYLTVNIEKTNDLMKMLATPYAIYYVGGICYWQNPNPHDDSPRYVLSDVAVMGLQQWHLTHKNDQISVKLSSIKSALVYYLESLSDFDWSDLSILKLRVIRRIDNVLKYGPVQYRMYFVPGVCQPLPHHVFIRLLTGSASKFAQASLELSITEKTKAFEAWSSICNSNHIFVSMAETQQQLENVFKAVSLLEKKPKSRANSLDKISSILDKSVSKENPYFWTLCSWLYELINKGGSYKRNLQISTTIDYVKSVSKPFLIVFSTCDISLLSGEDWASKLNEAAEYFPSVQRKKYIYYFAQFLVNSGFVDDLCLSDIDVVGSSSEVDANLISIEHVEVLLLYLDDRAADCPIHKYAYFLLCFCFFSGLRRNEAAKLTWADFSFSLKTPSQDEFDYVQLSVRPNKHRRLKTTSARRELPLDALWPQNTLVKLRSYYQINKDAGVSTKSLLFDNAKYVNKAYELITDLMRHYTGDYSLRIHHNRHSFGNWTWCRLNDNIIKIGRQHLTIFEHELFDQKYLDRLQIRLRYNANTRKKMFILSHMMGHKDVQSTLNSYLHIKDILYFIQQKQYVNLTKHFTSECVGRATLLPTEPGLSLAERLCYYTQDVAERLEIKPAPSTNELILPTLSNFSTNISAGITISCFTWARAIYTLKTSPINDVATHFHVPLEQLQSMQNNAQLVHKNYPRRGKKLPLIPNFPRISRTNQVNLKDSKMANSCRVFKFLCDKFDQSINENKLTIENIQLSMEILKYAVPGKDYALRCPDSKVSRMFIRFCQLLGLKGRHIKFRFHRADLTNEQSQKTENRWKKTISDHGFQTENFTVASQSEGRFLGKHDGNGFLEIAIVNNKYARIQRHHSIFSFLHLLLILSYERQS